MEFDVHFTELLKVLISLLLGGLIGLERELANKPAGLRTHMLVSSAATLFVILGNFMVHRFSNDLVAEVIRTDPVRIMDAIITGISFLGAGTIIFRNRQESVEGLTTAASILFVSAIGITVALGQFLMATVLTIMVIAVLISLGYIERRIGRLRKWMSYEKKQDNT